MSKGFFILLLVFMAFPCIANQNIFNFPLNNETKKQISTVEERLSQNAVVRGDFKQTKNIKGIEKKFISIGNFLFSKVKGLYWNIQKPFPSTMIFTEKGLIQIEDGKKSFISSEEQPFFSRFSKVFAAVLAGNLDTLEQYFQIFFKMDKTNWTIGLKAKEDLFKKAIKEMIIKGDQYVESIKIIEDRDNVLLMEFSNFVNVPEDLTDDEKSYFEK